MSEAREYSAHPPAYTGLKVVELASTPGAEYTSRLLAEMGAAVLKVEPPAGADSRRVGPFAADVDDGEHSLHFWFYNGDKRSLRLDLASEDGRARFESLLATADIWVTDLAPSELAALSLSLETIAAKCPRLVIVAVTAYGLTGPWRDYRSSDLVALAAGGPLHMCGYDDHTIPPIRPGGNQGYHTAMAFAHIGVLLALIDRERTGLGQIVDTSMHAACAMTVELANPYWFYPRALVFRQTCRHAQPVATQPTLFECADGYVYFALVITEEKPWQALIEWLGHHDLLSGLDDPVYLDAGYRQKHFHDIQQVVEAFFLVNSAHDMYREGQSRGLPIGILNAPEDLFADKHLRARGFFLPVEHPGTGMVEYAGPAYWFSGCLAVLPRPAPRLGEADAEYGARP